MAPLENRLPAEVAHLLKAVFPVLILHTVGVGMMWPAIPAMLLETFGGDVPRVAQYLAEIHAASAIVGFLSAPIFGALSDSVGRRAFLLTSLTIASFCNIVVAVYASPFAVMIAKLTFASTNVAKAMCYALLVDTLAAAKATKAERVRAFGLIGMAVGCGFAAGPIIGGLVGLSSPKTTALASSLLMACNTVLAACTINETLLHSSDPLLLPWSKLRVSCERSARILATPSAFFFALSFLLGGIASGPYSIWYVFAKRRFGWSSFDSGQFLAGFGLAAVLSQGFLLPWLVPQRLSERALVALSFGTNAALFCCYGAVGREQSGLLFALLPLCMMGTLSEPVLRHVFPLLASPEDQGALQGALAALSALASAVGPLIAAQLLSVGETQWCLGLLCHGAPFFVSSCLFALASVASSVAFSLYSPGAAHVAEEKGHDGHERNDQRMPLLYVAIPETATKTSAPLQHAAPIPFCSRLADKSGCMLNGDILLHSP
jgi:DHA1 family tetracycline resistance protein-like MFS transporter